MKLCSISNPQSSSKPKPMSAVATVDLKDLDDFDSDQVQAVGDSLKECGFVNLIGHGISSQLLESVYNEARLFFSLDESVKRTYENVECGRQRGYTPFLAEKAKGEQEGDLKEFWHVGRPLPLDHPNVSSNLMRPNRFPAELPNFGEVMLKMYREMDLLAHRMLSLISRYLGYPPSIFEELAHEGNSVLRALHYPDVDERSSAGKVRAAAHEDINLLTLLPVATRPGLELLNRHGDWISVESPPNAIICDTGDMMSLLTGGEMPATTHRVVNPEGEGDGGRLSLPFFMHPHPHAPLAPLAPLNGGRSTHPLCNAHLTAHEFLNRRLFDNGLIDR
jgi:isopenicillin N synthase-like dioxygenase